MSDSVFREYQAPADSPSTPRGRNPDTVVDPVLLVRHAPSAPAASRVAARAREVTDAPAHGDSVVHIHIGSIELRAATPAPEPKPRRREAPAPPPLSEFLRSREVRR